MKEIKETKLVEKTIVKFIANDGKEFIGENAEYECKRYEMNLDKEKFEKEFKKLDVKEIRIPLLDFFFNDVSLYKVNLKNEYEFNTFIDYVRKDYDFVGFDVCIKLPETYPYKAFIVIGDYWADEYKGDLKFELEKVLEQLK